MRFRIRKAYFWAEGNRSALSTHGGVFVGIAPPSDCHAGTRCQPLVGAYSRGPPRRSSPLLLRRGGTEERRGPWLSPAREGAGRAPAVESSGAEPRQLLPGVAKP